ncbi:MAG: PilN domain-containing protein [Desulfatirhabdiaceae bacterium]
MIRINLLPYRQVQKQENIRRQVSIFLLGLILIACGIYYVGSLLSRQQAAEENRIQKAKIELAELKKITKEIEEIKKKLQIIKKKTEIIHSLETDRKDPVLLLDALTSLVVPDRMWFTQLTATGGTVAIGGLAKDQTTVAEFMKRLEGSVLFESVQLRSIRQQTIRNVNLKGFDITCKKAALKPPVKEASK